MNKTWEKINKHLKNYDNLSKSYMKEMEYQLNVSTFKTFISNRIKDRIYKALGISYYLKELRGQI